MTGQKLIGKYGVLQQGKLQKQSTAKHKSTTIILAVYTNKNKNQVG